MPQTGEVKEVHFDGRTAMFEWRIYDFSRIEHGYYYSPFVEYFNREWWLMINMTADGIDSVWLHRKLPTSGIPAPFQFSIQCMTSNGEERVINRDVEYPEQWVLCGKHIDPPWRIPSWAGLTLTCSIRKGDSPHAPGVSRDTRSEGASCSKSRIVNPGSKGVSRETPTKDDCQYDEHLLEDMLILGEHLKKLLLSGTGHDVLVKVGDKRFRAHKHILEARSPVFAAMFGSDMAERAGDSVTIEDCDPDTFGQFLQFVYCGKADIASVGGALSLYYAGDKYDFPSLKRMCVRFLKGSFSTTTVFDVVSLASRHEEDELLQEAIVYFADNYQEVWSTMEWQRFLLSNPKQAYEMNVKVLQCKSCLYEK